MPLTGRGWCVTHDVRADAQPVGVESFVVGPAPRRVLTVVDRPPMLRTPALRRVGVWRGGLRLSMSVCRLFRLAVP
jgi:hypothetical protein